MENVNNYGKGGVGSFRNALAWFTTAFRRYFDAPERYPNPGSLSQHNGRGLGWVRFSLEHAKGVYDFVKNSGVLGEGDTFVAANKSTYKINTCEGETGHAFYGGAIDPSQLDLGIVARAVMVLDLNKYVFGDVSEVQSAHRAALPKASRSYEDILSAGHGVDFLVNVNTYDPMKPRTFPVSRILEQMQAILDVLLDSDDPLYQYAPQTLLQLAGMHHKHASRLELWPEKGKKEVFIYALIRLKKDGVRLQFAQRVLRRLYSRQGVQLEKIITILLKQGGHGTVERRLAALKVISPKIAHLKLTRLTPASNTREDKTARQMFEEMLDTLDGLQCQYTFVEGDSNRAKYRFKDMKLTRRISSVRQERLQDGARLFDQLERDRNRGSKRKAQMSILRKEREELAVGLSLAQKQAATRDRMLALNEECLKKGKPLHFSKSTSPVPRGAYPEALVFARQEGQKRYAKRLKAAAAAAAAAADATAAAAAANENA
jgi:hypothetical protein